MDDWNFPQSDKLAEIEKTGSNAIRIQWYINYGQLGRPAYSLQDLDNFLTRCKASRIIPILFLGDLTCEADTNLLNTQLMPWWTSEPVLTVLRKHQQYLIVNLANELGACRWTNDPDSALITFKNAYKVAITNLRQYLQLPIMIDAPDGGTSLDAFTKIGQELIDHDPQHNLLLSCHNYWSIYDGMPHIETTVNANLPIVFGEVANQQDEIINGKTQYCYYSLDGTDGNYTSTNGFTYQTLLQVLKEKEIGWLAWNWWKDGCKKREMSEDGSFINLTPYGNDLINHPLYGLSVTSQKSSAFD
jgi:mannan endo-1,4-beta-mannosidase